MRVVAVTNPFRPHLDREVRDYAAPMTVTAILDEVANDAWGSVVLVDGVCVHPDDWDTHTVDVGAAVSVLAIPAGGDEKNPLALILTIGLAAVTGPLAAGLLNASGLVAGLSGAAAATALSITKVAVGLVGSALIGAITSRGPSNQPAYRGAADIASPSPTYSLAARGNQARLGGPIPVLYGRHLVYPAYGATPYTEYRGNEQYLMSLLVLGQGEYDIEQIRIDDTVFWQGGASTGTFPEVRVQIVAPGQPVTLFPVDVVQSSEVAGADLETGVTIGPFVASGPGETTQRIGLDVVCPRGLFFAEDNGALSSKQVGVTVEARQIDDLGQPLPGAVWTTIQNIAISGATTTSIRRSYSIDVARGRYEVRVRRTDTKDTSTRAGHDVAWTALRAYLPGDQMYAGVTVLAVEMRATNALSQRSATLINCIARRRLPRWDPVTGWSAPAYTRNPAWAVADILRAEYGARLADSRIDLTTLAALAATCDARQDYFDAVFDNTTTCWEAAQSALQVVRSACYQQSGLVTFVRDEQQSTPLAVFSPRNMLAGSFQVSFEYPAAQAHDGITAQYYDERFWQPRTVTAGVLNDNPSNPQTVELFGVTTRAHAYREAKYLAAASRYRRISCQWDTELEGYIPAIGDLVAVNHDVPSWGQSGDVLAYQALTATTGRLTLSEPHGITPLVPSPGFLVGWPSPVDGSLLGPFPVLVAQDSASVDVNHGTLLAALRPETDETIAERTRYVLGTASTVRQMVRVVPPIEPRGLTVSLSGLVEDNRVHSADGSVPPAEGATPALPALPAAPVVSALQVRVGGTPDAPVAVLTWTPARGADSYIVQLANNVGSQTTSAVEYEDAGTYAGTTAIIPVELGTFHVRVAGVGLTVGPFVFATATADPDLPPSAISNLSIISAAGGRRFQVAWGQALRAVQYQVQVINITGTPTLLRTWNTRDTQFFYGDDELRLDGGPFRNVRFSVRAIGAGGLQGPVSNVDYTNPQAPAIVGARVYSAGTTIFVAYTRPPAADFAGVEVHLSTTSGFTPSAATRVWEGTDSVAAVSEDGAGNGLSVGTYYLRVGAFDTFGRDGINYGSQYTITLAAFGLDAEAIVDTLNAALTDPSTASTVGSFIVSADRFAVRLPTADRAPFIVGSDSSGNPAVVLDAQTIIGGNLSVANLRAGALPADVVIDVGDGSLVIDGAGSITAYDGPRTVSNRDYATFNAGTLTFFEWWADLNAGAGGYLLSKSVTKWHTGTANGGQLVTLPGRWKSQPTVFVSPFSLRTFDAANNATNQRYSVRAQNLAQTAIAGEWSFTAVAELTLEAGSGTVNVGGATTGSGTVTSPTYTPPGGTAGLTVTVRLNSVRGNATSTFGYHRRVATWRVEGSPDGTNWTALHTARAVNIPDSITSPQTDSVTVSLAGHNRFRVVTTYSDGTGQFSLGADTYAVARTLVVPINASGTVRLGDPNVPLGRVASGTIGRNALGVTLAPNESIYRVDYRWSCGSALGGFHPGATGVPRHNFGDPLGVVAWRLYVPNAPSSAYSLGPWDPATAGGSGGAYYFKTARNHWAILQRATIGGALDGPTQTYNTAHTGVYVSPSGGSFTHEFFAEDEGATVHTRTVTLNSSTADNSLAVQSYTWSTAGSVNLDTSAALNWIAIGE